MPEEVKEIKVENIDENSTGWISRLLGAFIIAISVAEGADTISDALHRNTEAVEKQTQALQNISPQSP